MQHLRKWGNSLALRVPSHIAKLAMLKVGDLVMIRLTDAGDIVIRVVNQRALPSGYAVDGEPREPARELTDEEVRLKW